MGWIVWLLLTGLCFVASYLVAAALYPERGLLDRLAVSFVLAPALILLDLHACGIVGQLAPIPLSLLGLVLFGGVGALAARRAGGATLLPIVRADLRAPLRLAHDTVRLREPAVLALVPALWALAICGVMVWYFKSWTWDPVWYHVPITSYAIQERTVGWIDTHNVYLQGYPRNIELLAAWNCVFPHDNRFDETSQLPFAVLGMLAVAAWARRAGASRPLAAGVGAAWFALPPAFLQAHTTHVDVATAALVIAAVYFVTAPGLPRARDRWLALIALGIYLGSKYTALMHLAFLAPWLAWRALLEIRAARPAWLARVGNIALSLALFFALGAHKYLQNALHTGNPLWPFRTQVPLLGRTLPGPEDVGYLYGLPPGTPTAFFGAPGDLQHMLTSWFDPHPFYAPDVRSGGFGPVFCWLLLPCMVFVLGDLVRLRRVREGLVLVAMFIGAVVVPAAWWSRYTLPAAAAALIAFSMVHTEVPRWPLRAVLSCVFVALVWQGFADGRAGFITYPRDLARARAASWTERSALQIDSFLWPTEMGLLRERELRPGDVFVYDQGAYFLQEYFCRDYRTRLVFVSSEGDPRAFLARVRALRARWVGVRQGSPAAAAVRQAGATYLFTTGPGQDEVFRMPGAGG